ncbi:MAG TPA: helix-turn-helix transcriptional regulator [Solirubrobacteraceae bacterium]|nr:helix-turn-helix transcriptional regulator [Solirubrobacteraceae bacterium]
MGAYTAERDELLEQFAKRLRELRKANFPSQEALADAATLHRTQIGSLEQGKREPGLLTLMILADTFGITIDRLVKGVPVPKERRPPPSRRGGKRG